MLNVIKIGFLEKNPIPRRGEFMPTKWHDYYETHVYFGLHDVARVWPRCDSRCSPSPRFLGFPSYSNTLTHGLGFLLQPPSLHFEALASFPWLWARWLDLEVVYFIWWNLNKKEVYFGARKHRALLDPSSYSSFWTFEHKNLTRWPFSFEIHVLDFDDWSLFPLDALVFLGGLELNMVFL